VSEPRPLYPHVERPARVGIFLSGGGSNARVLLSEHRRLGPASPIEPVCLVTDAPDDPRCGARALSERFGIPVVGLDIRAFYRERGLKRVSVRTPEGCKVREEWTDRLRELLAPYRLDFAAFAGFEPLTNLVADFPCLNVHPGDLTFLKDGRRYLVGLHTVPIERAILLGHTQLRSSVIVARPFHGDGSDMDSGPVLGLSEPVPVDLKGHSLEELRAVEAARRGQRPPGGWGDLLEEIAAWNQQRLKEGGDWVVFPRVVFETARGCFAVDEQDRVYFRPSAGEPFRLVERVVFGPQSVSPQYAQVGE